ncbi:hypothetical protein [Nocardia sp. NPDC058497]|uniref:hypothetical protein n=1 Tax=Nocardia sp. NPDC058497 TaxID=3346529 RepID=UPI00365CFD3C
MKIFGSAVLLALVGLILANFWPAVGITVLVVALVVFAAGCVVIGRTTRSTRRRGWGAGAGAGGAGGFTFFASGDGGGHGHGHSDGGGGCGGGGCGGGGGGCGGGS